MALLDDEFEFFFEKAWSNGLPVVPPTEGRIERMFSGTKRSPEEVLGVIPPAFEKSRFNPPPSMPLWRDASPSTCPSSSPA